MSEPSKAAKEFQQRIIAEDMPVNCQEFLLALDSFARRARLEEHRQHGGHMHNCTSFFRDTGDECSCGYLNRIAQLEKEKG